MNGAAQAIVIIGAPPLAPVSGGQSDIRLSAAAGEGKAGVTAARPIVLRVRRARRWPERLTGLIGKPAPAAGTGLWLQPCAAVHTFGVRGALDLLFVDRRGRIVGICERVRPGRVRGHWRAAAVLELRAGDVRRLDIRGGMQLRWVESGAESGVEGGTDPVGEGDRT